MNSKPVNVTKSFAALQKHFEFKTSAANQTKLFYYVKKLIDLQHLSISSFVGPNIFVIAIKKDNLSFVQYIKTINCS